MATLNLAAAVAITSWPERQTDLDTIQRWGGNWLLHGDDIYTTDRDYPDYPPHAILLLSPLGLMPLEWAVRSWSLIRSVGGGLRLTGSRCDSIGCDFWRSLGRAPARRSPLARRSSNDGVVVVAHVLHLTYGFLILLPLAAWLLFVEIPGTQMFRRRLFWSLQLGMMFDVPGWSWRLDPLLSIPDWADILLSL